MYYTATIISSNAQWNYNYYAVQQHESNKNRRQEQKVLPLVAI